MEKIQFKKNKNEITYFTKKEEELLVDYLTNNMNLRNLSILLGLFSGIRVGKICGLRWSDLDFINNTLSVNRTTQRIKNLDDEKYQRRSITTVREYKQLLNNWILKEIGDIKLRNITEQDLEKLYDKMRKAVRQRDGQPLSETYVCHCHKLITSIFNYANLVYSPSK